MQDNNVTRKVALITGGSKRIGATVARHLHTMGMNLVLHYRHAEGEARNLQAELDTRRQNSVLLLQADLLNISKLTRMIQQVLDHYGRLDVLINNASSFYPTPIGQANENDWEDLLGTNLKAPFFLSQAAAPHLQATQGCIINLTDVYAERPLRLHPIYSVAKAGLVMLTKTLARELGPQVRVNAIAPGVILWPEHEINEVAKQRIISATALKRQGCPEDIAKAVWFLIHDADYITGQVLAVEGGRMLNQ